MYWYPYPNRNMDRERNVNSCRNDDYTLQYLFDARVRRTRYTMIYAISKK